VHEQARDNESWFVDSVMLLSHTDGVITVHGSMCSFGLVDRQGKLLRKNFTILTNGAEIARTLNKPCTKNHEHGDIHGFTKQSAIYPKAFCHAMLRGIKNELKARGVWEYFVFPEIGEAHEEAEAEEDHQVRQEEMEVPTKHQRQLL